MRAKAGDRIIVMANHIGQPERHCEVKEVRGSDGGPPYVVCWADNGQEALFFPGSDAVLQTGDHVAH